MRIQYPIDSIRTLCQPSGEIGDFDGAAITGVATLAEARAGDLAFLASARFRDQLSASQASVVLVPRGLEIAPVSGQLLLEVERPSWALALVCGEIEKSLRPPPLAGIHPSSVVEAGAEVDPTAAIGPFCLIESGAKIGADCEIGAGCAISGRTELGAGSTLHPRVSLVGAVRIGCRSIVHSGSVIGADGFAYEFIGGQHRKVPQVGSVEIGDDVEIGANTTIDRGRLGPTRVGSGTKIDNQVQIGHNVQIGRHCMICAQVGIAGSTTIGEYAVFGGRSGASGHIEIGKGAQLAGCAVAFTDLEPGGKYGGVPAIPLNAYMRVAAITRKLPDLFKRLRALEERDV